MQNYVYNTVTTTAFSPLNPKAKVKKIVVFPPPLTLVGWAV